MSSIVTKQFLVVILQQVLTSEGSSVSSGTSSSPMLSSGEDERHHTDRDWSDEEIEHIISTIFTFLLIFILSYLILIRPWLSQRKVPRQQTQHQQGAAATAATTTTNAAMDASALTQHNLSGSDNGSARLVDGVQCYASMLSSWRSSSQSLPTPADFRIGKQLMQTLASVSQTPSIAVKRGSIVVVTLKAEDLRKEQQQFVPTNKNSALFLRYLACMTNLFVLISFDANSTTTTTTIDKQLKELSILREALYQMGLPSQLVPPHRIVAASSSVGRIAFVRQLRPEFFIDYDLEVKDQLQRFGFQVILYGGKTKAQNNDNDYDEYAHKDAIYSSLRDFLPSTDKALAVEYSDTNINDDRYQVPQHPK
jgi:hypothetical protein